MPIGRGRDAHAPRRGVVEHRPHQDPPAGLLGFEERPWPAASSPRGFGQGADPACLTKRREGSVRIDVAHVLARVFELMEERGKEGRRVLGLAEALEEAAAS